MEGARLQIVMEGVRSHPVQAGAVSDKKRLVALVANIIGESSDRIGEILKNGSWLKVSRSYKDMMKNIL